MIMLRENFIIEHLHFVAILKPDCARTFTLFGRSYSVPFLFRYFTLTRHLQS